MVKNKRSKEQRSFLKYAAVSTAVFVLFLLFKRDSVITWIRTGFALKSQRQQIEALSEQNEQLDLQINNLNSNRDSLETYARETFFFAEPGEDVYVLE